MENEQNNSGQEAGEMTQASNANTFSVSCGMNADRTEKLEFAANGYKKVQVALQGHYRIQVIGKPSQYFVVKVNGKQIYADDLFGDKIVEYVLLSTEFNQTLTVEVALTKASVASAAAGSMAITLFQ